MIDGNPQWRQDDLSGKIIRDNLKENPGFFPLIITLDSTPATSFLLQVERIRQDMPDRFSAKYFPPKRNLTPLDLLDIKPPRVVMATSEWSDKCCEAFADAYSNKRPNVIYPTPITSIAWSIFMNKISVIDTVRAKTEINYFKSTLSILGSRVKDVNTLHMLKLIDPESVLIQDQLNLSADDRDILLLRLGIFNKCLRTAARIGSKHLGKEIIPF